MYAGDGGAITYLASRIPTRVRSKVLYRCVRAVKHSRREALPPQSIVTCGASLASDTAVSGMEQQYACLCFFPGRSTMQASVHNKQQHNRLAAVCIKAPQMLGRPPPLPPQCKYCTMPCMMHTGFTSIAWQTYTRMCFYHGSMRVLFQATRNVLDLLINTRVNL